MDDSNFTFGINHMNMEHNTLFSLGDTTAAPAVLLMDSGTDAGITTGAPTGTIAYGVNSFILPADFSTDASTEGRVMQPVDSISLDLAMDSTENPDLAVASGALVCGTTTYGGPAGMLIIIFQNNQPNSYVERNAAEVYSSLHRGAKKPYCFPAVIAESPKAHETAAKVFGKGSLDHIMERLDVWEAILQEQMDS